ncbi:GNAT family N-acetyltransferase [Rubrimonas cliftonensis]|uniref:Acetyltransferase (GNAT) family protein n=1 Tax=Rubrimonas cliftonensis TaxID=89524 RepID=A0A1H3YHV7_9RHOB|nr:GNAT family N-acetyltransferase [Rubrimonas cliftonensis]SEA10458.1 Acetyltransferase (GNAT) family protein [Rubrimonas cliftonensis]
MTDAAAAPHILSGPAAPDRRPAASPVAEPTGFAMRDAEAGDVEAIVAMLADDPLGAAREAPGDPGYAAAFAAIAADPGERLMVAAIDGAVVGCLQLGVVPTLSRRGASRAVIEGVRVAAPWRSRGVGAAMVRRAVEIARARGCAMVQLATDRSRTDAQRFYARLGFEPSHVGMKLML